MERKLKIETGVGIGALLVVVLVSVIGLFGLGRSCFKFNSEINYPVYAVFNNIGELKVQAPVKLGGVKVGRIRSITLDPKSLKAKVELSLQAEYDSIPKNAAAVIETTGLLGETYLAIKLPAYFDPEEMDKSDYLSPGDTIFATKDAVLLSDLLEEIEKLRKNLLPILKSFFLKS